MPKDDPSSLTQLEFDSSRLDIKMEGALNQLQGVNRSPREMNIREIKKELENIPLTDPRSAGYRVELHKKISIAFACLAFVLAGFPLGCMVKKGGRLVGFIFAIGLIFIYYVLLSTGETYGYEGKIRPFLSMWIANFFMAFIGFVLSFFAFRELKLNRIFKTRRQS